MESLTRQCTATSRSGEPCRRAPIRGGTVCIMHGGKAPQTMEAARLYLNFGRDLAIDAIHRALVSGPPCTVCGRSDSDRDPAVIRAAQIVLDRTGFGPSAHLSVSPDGDGTGRVTTVRRIIIDALPEATLTPDGVDVEDAATPVEPKHGPDGIRTPDSGVAEEQS